MLFVAALYLLAFPSAKKMAKTKKKHATAMQHLCILLYMYIHNTNYVTTYECGQCDTFTPEIQSAELAFIFSLAKFQNMNYPIKSTYRFTLQTNRRKNVHTSPPWLLLDMFFFLHNDWYHRYFSYDATADLPSSGLLSSLWLL